MSISTTYRPSSRQKLTSKMSSSSRRKAAPVALQVDTMSRLTTLVSTIDTASRYRSLPSPSGHLRNAAYQTAQPPTEIIPRLFLADLSVAESPEMLMQLGITHILSTMSGTVSIPSNVPLRAWKQIHLVDNPFAELTSHLLDATAFIKTALDDPNARVLVHCVQGISRSSSVVCALLMRLYGWSPSQAVSYVKSKRPSAEPNPGFVLQLGEFAKQLSKAHAASGRR